MINPRPVGYVIGLLVTVLGVSMAVPMAVDFAAGNGHWTVFVESAVLTTFTGVLLALACANTRGHGLTLRQTFLLTTSAWVALPLFGALPLMLGETALGFTDAFFEAMSAMTTTGSTVIAGLDALPPGLLLWRGMMQWFGGIGIVVVAMAFLPELRVGGMQIFRSEAFDTIGKILPRAAEIASQIVWIYVTLTIACAAIYFALGMTGFDAIVHALTTLSTGGFANYDASFGAHPPATQYVAALFMLLAALPFVRYVQMVAGGWGALLGDAQVRGLLWLLVLTTLTMVAVQVAQSDRAFEPALRSALFNVVSIGTGTGYASEDYALWGPLPVTLFFFLGLIGGAAGSTACSVKIFRYQILLAALNAQIRSIHSPRGVFVPRYEGRPVTPDVMNSVIAFFMFFVVTLGVLAVLLAMTGLDFITSVSGAATALANIGPGLGAEIGPSGNFAGLNDTAKWLLCAGMLLGRLELLVVLVLFTVQFWRG